MRDIECYKLRICSHGVSQPDLVACQTVRSGSTGLGMTVYVIPAHLGDETLKKPDLLRGGRARTEHVGCIENRSAHEKEEKHQGQHDHVEKERGVAARAIASQRNGKGLRPHVEASDGSYPDGPARSGIGGRALLPRCLRTLLAQVTYRSHVLRIKQSDIRVGDLDEPTTAYPSSSVPSSPSST